MAIALGMAMVALLILSATVAASPGWMQRIGTIGHAESLADGSHVYLDAVKISKIRSSQTPPDTVLYRYRGMLFGARSNHRCHTAFA